MARLIKRIRRTSAVALVLTIGAAVGALALPMPAQATNFGSTACGGTPRNCVSVANNIYHAIRMRSMGDIYSLPGMVASAQSVINNVYNPTNLVVYRDEADSVPDVWMSDDDYGNNGVVAWVECPTNNTGTGGSHPNRWCRGQELRFNLYFYTHNNGYYDTDAQRRFVACHELGHTLGLRHSTETASCLRSTLPSQGTPALTNHDRAHLQNFYG